MEIVLVSPDQQRHYTAALDQAYVLRHRVFNETLGWDLPHLNGRERDMYDPLAYHLIAFDTPGRVGGYWRLTPTTGRYLTGDVFNDLFEGGTAPSSDAVWELSRFSIDNAQFEGRFQSRTRMMVAMGCAVMEFAILNGIAEFLSVQDDYITKGTRLIIGDPHWNSETRNYGACNATCYAYAPSLERLYAMRTRYALGAPVLRQFRLPAYSQAA